MKKTFLFVLASLISIYVCFSQNEESLFGHCGLTVSVDSDNNSLIVTEVVSGSLAEIFGLRISDRISKMNNVIPSKKISLDNTDGMFNRLVTVFA